jgi:transcriptional regulator with PAS, ATPase and Fis domain
MRTKNDDSTTIREVGPALDERAIRPVLLVGSFTCPTGRVVDLDRTITIGRSRSSDAGDGDRDTEVMLPSDGALSRPHLRITADRDGWRIEDLGSTNGTFVDGRRVQKPMLLSDGNIVHFGGHVGAFRRVSGKERAAIDHEAAAPFGPVPTLSPALAGTAAGLRRLAGTDASLLFAGETGVGKEIYARAVHAASGRTGAFVAINCAALPAELVESELFGYARGAHSTATVAKQGLVELADQGTLLLDEIGDMPPRVQAKLFRFLQDREVLPLGSTRARRVDVRVLAATSDLSESVREDLVGRLGAEPIVIPPLRHRIEDLGPLIAHLGGAGFPGMDPAAFRALCLYDWPRNVRQLDEVLKRALTLAGGKKIGLDDLPAGVRGALERGPRMGGRRAARARPEREELERVLRENRGNVASVAKVFDRQWNVVQRWLRRYGLDAGRYRA